MEIFHRALGYGLFAGALAWVGCGGKFSPFVDIPGVIMMASGVLGALLAGMGVDSWSALRAWPLGKKVDVAQAKHLERACGLAVAASWATGIGVFILDAMIMMDSAAKEPLSRESWWAGGMVSLSALLYMGLSVWFFSIHLSRVRRWLAKRGR